MNPTVTIGFPVYNGATRSGTGLVAAIESILMQSFSNFELVISDNASIDHTQEICQSFASQDKRVRYLRQVQNIGATANFEFVFENSRGDLFMWAAADDVRHPLYLEKAVRRLSDEMTAVLAASDVIFVKYVSGRRRRHVLTSGIADPDASVRFRTIVRNGCWSALYGLIRRSALSKTRRYSAMPHLASLGIAPDYKLIELCLQGHFAYIDEPLLELSTRAPRTQAELTFDLTPTAHVDYASTFWWLFSDLWHLSGRHHLSIPARLRLLSEFLASSKAPGSLHHALLTRNQEAERQAREMKNFGRLMWIRAERRVLLEPFGTRRPAAPPKP